MAKIPYITLSDTLNTSRLRINQLIDSVGDLTLLTTDDSATIVGAINFLDSNAGRKTALTTTIKTSIVAGINEHDAELGTITAAAMKAKLGASTVSGALAAISDSIGSGPLTTVTKTVVSAINELDSNAGRKANLTAGIVNGNIVGAINFLDSNAGRKVNLTTTVKTNLVNAINEHDTELGTITAAAMKAKLGATTVSGALSAISDSIGSGPLTTTSKTAVGAINEHDGELGTITPTAMKAKLGATTVSGALSAISDSIGSGPLTTTATSLVGAANEIVTKLGTITPTAMKTKLGATTVSGALAAISDSIGSGPLTTTATTLVGAVNETTTKLGTITPTAMKAKLGATTVSGALAAISDSIGSGPLTTVTKTLTSAINELDSNAGRKANLTTSVKTNLASAINSVKDSSAAVTGPIGALITSIKTNIVNAVNTVDSNAGRLSNLTTITRLNLVSAINEHDGELGTITATAIKAKLGATTVSGALAAISDSIGSGPLTTTSTTLVGAINENVTKQGTITPTGMKAKLGATTISGALSAISDSIGSGPLTTTATTLVGAVNETTTKLGTITPTGMKAKLGATTISGALSAISDSIGSGPLTTTSKTLIGAVNELKTREDTTQTHVVDSAGQLILKSGGASAAKFTNSNVQFQGYVTSLTALATTQQDYTGAINELKSTLNSIAGTQINIIDSSNRIIGSLSNLNTGIVNGNIVGAINFLDSNAGRKANLNTTAKTTLVAAINENKGRLDSINAAGVGTPQLKALGVTTAKIADNNVTFAKLPLATTGKRVIASTVSGVIYSEQQVDSDMITSSAVSSAKIQTGAITTAKIATSAVDSDRIATDAVSTIKIRDVNVTTGKLANNAVTYAKMQTSSVANRVVGATASGVQLSEVQINSAMIAAGAVDSAALKAYTVTLGTKTTGPYVASLAQGTGVTITNNSGAGTTPTIAIGQAVGTTSNVTFNDVTVSGNLIVSGTTTSINTETITLNDNIIVLNNNANPALAATENAGIEIERGADSNVSILWNETTNRWTFTNNSNTVGPYYNIPLPNEYVDSARSKFPTTYAWTAGTTSGPTGSLTGNNLTAISFPAIPAANDTTASGIITTGAQTIGGTKTFSSTITGSITGNAGTATTLATARNFSLTGPVTAAAVSFNGSNVVALATAITAGAVDSSAHGSLSISTAKIQDNAVTSAKLSTAVSLIIYNSAGTALKTLYGAGA